MAFYELQTAMAAPMPFEEQTLSVWYSSDIRIALNLCVTGCQQSLPVCS